ncbi:ester cyclase [Nonomuraea sp. NPDC052265]|uniref:ester cyclase n=1 Tax=Nonomuraea sp. NPDC052265 TaxID=3364374 RepID=UPI0037C53E26
MPATEEARNRETYQRFHDAVNSGDLEVISKAAEEFLHPDARFHTAEGGALPAVQAQKRVWDVLLRAFPDIHVSVEDLIVTEDKIISRQKVTGTHTGEYRGRPATGRAVAYDEIFIARLSDGRITDLWGVVDLYAQLRQLGFVEEQAPVR